MIEYLENLFWVQIWQVTALTVCVAVFNRYALRNRPHFATLLWLVVLIKCVTPPVWNSPSSIFSWIQHPESSNLAAADDSVDLLPRAREDSPYVVTVSSGNLQTDVGTAALPKEKTSENELPLPATQSRSTQMADSSLAGNPNSSNIQRAAFSIPWIQIWAIGFFTMLLLGVIRYIIFWGRIKKTLRRDPELTALCKRLRRKFNVRRTINVLVTDSLFGPAIVGFIRPTILLPRAIVDTKPACEIEPILAHEINHLRRGDIWFAGFQFWVISVWWFHPLVWMINRMITRDIEKSCDESTVARMNYSPAEYARCLLDVVQLKKLKAVPSFPGVRRIDITKNRLERIMKLRQGSRHVVRATAPLWCWLLAVTFALMTVPGAAFVLAQEPSPRVQDPKKTPMNSEAPDEKAKVRTYDVTKALKAYAEYHKLENAETVRRAFADHLRMNLQALALRDRAKSNRSGSGSLPYELSKFAWKENQLIVIENDKNHERLQAAIKYAESGNFDLFVVDMVLIETKADIADQLGVVKKTERFGLLKRSYAGIRIADSAEEAKEIGQILMTDKKAVTIFSPRVTFMNGTTASVTQGVTIPLGPKKNGKIVRAGGMEAWETQFVGRRVTFDIRPVSNRDLTHLGMDIELSARQQGKVKLASHQVGDKKVVIPVPETVVRNIQTGFTLKPKHVYMTSVPTPAAGKDDVTIVIVNVSRMRHQKMVGDKPSEYFDLITNPIRERMKKASEVVELKDLETQIYHIGDLLKSMKGLGPQHMVDEKKSLETTLVELIKTQVPAKYWSEKTAIAYYPKNQSLIVRQSKANHSRIKKMLTEYRFSASHKISLKSKVLKLDQNVKLPKDVFGKALSSTEQALIELVLESKSSSEPFKLAGDSSFQFHTVSNHSKPGFELLAKSDKGSALKIQLLDLDSVEKPRQDDVLLDGQAMNAFQTNWQLSAGKQSAQVELEIRPGASMMTDVTSLVSNRLADGERAILVVEFGVHYDQDSFKQYRAMMKAENSSAGQPLPSAYYLKDDVQYYPKGQEYKLWREAERIKESREKEEPIQGEINKVKRSRR